MHQLQRRFTSSTGNSRSSTSADGVTGSTSADGGAGSTLADGVTGSTSLQLLLSRFHKHVLGAALQQYITHPGDHVLLEGLLDAESLTQQQVSSTEGMRAGTGGLRVGMGVQNKQHKQTLKVWQPLLG